MPVDMFIKIGDVEGEAQDKAHGKEIDVLAFSWGMSQAGTMHLGSGGGSGKVAVQDLYFTKFIDSSSARLLQAMTTHEHFPTATLIVRKSGKKQLEYVKLIMKDLVVTSLNIDEPEREGQVVIDERLREVVSLNFRSFEYKYVPQLVGGAGGVEKSMFWNIAESTDI